MRSAVVFATLALAGCGRSHGVTDEELGGLVLAPKDKADPLSVDKAAKEPREMGRALATKYRDGFWSLSVPTLLESREFPGRSEFERLMRGQSVSSPEAPKPPSYRAQPRPTAGRDGGQLGVRILEAVEPAAVKRPDSLSVLRRCGLGWLEFLFDLNQFAQVVAHSFEHTHPEVLVGHFAAPEAQRDFGLVALLDEAAQIAQLDLVIALVGPGPEFDFLDLDDFLARAGFLLALLFLVFEFAVIHQAAHGRIGRGGNFHQVNVVFLGQRQRVGSPVDAKLLAFHANQANFVDADFTVDTLFFFGCDV